MILVDARGEQCPIPVIKTKKAIEEATQEERVEVLVDNEIAMENVTKLGKELGGKVSFTKLEHQEYRIEIQLQEKQTKEEGRSRRKKIAVISSQGMGVGNEELGTVLMKGFLFALSKLEQLPEKILFYNGGAKLTVEGSDSLEDLREMEAAGVEILTCGTCLDYYGLKEKLSVGSVTNMYAIVEAMEEAEGILRP